MVISAQGSNPINSVLALTFMNRLEFKDHLWVGDRKSREVILIKAHTNNSGMLWISFSLQELI